jgi:ZIP family zinc transporter
MATALLAGLLAAVASSSLILGAALGIYARPSRRLIATVMAFGAGAMIEALAVELAFQGAEELVHEHQLGPLASWLYVAGGFAIGCVVYFFADRILEGQGGALRKHATFQRYLERYRHRFADVLHALHADHWPQLARHGVLHRQEIEHKTIAPLVVEQHGASTAAMAIFLGAVLDGIPSSVVIGSSFISLAAFDPTFFIAVVIGNLPQAMSSAAGLRHAGFAVARIFAMWTLLTLASGAAGWLGNLLLASAPPTVNVFVEAIGGGAILAMLASTMMPEAFEDGGPSVGIATVIGFLAAFLFTALKL